MSLDSSSEFESFVGNNLENLPKYCDHCKFLLVEELCLEEDYGLLHYGKCCVIGKVQKTSTGEALLENIRISNLSNEYSLPEGTLTLRLLTFSYFGTHLQNGLYVEINGEVVLINIKDCQNNHHTPLTSRGINEELQGAKNEDEQKKLLKYFHENYKPAIKVWFVQPISRASDLISRNLELRMLQEQT